MADKLEKDVRLTYETLKKSLGDPGFYLHQPASVKEIQTHASYVFIAKPWVYKIKKPVDFGFLDYSSLKKRRYYCFREVELNSRLCGEIYEGVIPIFEAGDQLKLGLPVDEGTQQPEAVEFLVKMRYLPDNNFMKNRVLNGEVLVEDIERISHILHSFYDDQNVDETIKTWGNAEKIRINTDENFEQTAGFKDELIPDFLYELIWEYTDTFYRTKSELFEERVKKNRVVDGHGDLHLEHIHLTDEHLCIYDCIEFNDRLRYQDYANDIAFLAMDLDFHQRPDLQHHLIQNMAELMGDENLTEIIDFYKCYRAYVRGKVEGLQAGDEKSSDNTRQEMACEARRYFNLAGRYAILGSRPVALILMGKIGTGKSTLSGLISDQFNLKVFSSDRVRKKLAGLPPEKASPEELHSYLYSREMSEETYKALSDCALEELSRQKSVILDATFSRRAKRKDLLKRLQSQEFNYCFVEVNAGIEPRKARLKARDYQIQTSSDARLDKLGDLDDIYEPPDELGDTEKIVVHTNVEPRETLAELFQKLMYLNFRT